jgi:hypothetical protein
VIQDNQVFDSDRDLKNFPFSSTLPRKNCCRIKRYQFEFDTNQLTGLSKGQNLMTFFESLV